MTKQATVVRIMVASPSDVSQERQIIRTVIYEWNDLHSLERSIVLLPVGWDSHSSPEMGDRPQAIINNQILRDCDLLVAVFWTKLGSKSGASSMTGTEEEIEEHLQARKPAMIYFSSAPVLYESVDAANYAALCAFKEKCRTTGLFAEYDSVAAFRQMFMRHLTQTIMRKFGDFDVQLKIERATPPPTADISRDAQWLLTEATRADADGTILMLSTLDGLTIAAGGTTFADAGEARDEARWRGALRELWDNSLVEDRSGKGEVFNVTHRGYDIANVLGPISPEPESLD